MQRGAAQFFLVEAIGALTIVTWFAFALVQSSGELVARFQLSEILAWVVGVLLLIVGWLVRDAWKAMRSDIADGEEAREKMGRELSEIRGRLQGREDVISQLRELEGGSND